VHDKDTFDHVLYAQDPTFDARASKYDGPESVDSTTGFVRSKERASSFGDARRSRVDHSPPRRARPQKRLTPNARIRVMRVA
jgi:hypothetical protein